MLPERTRQTLWEIGFFIVAVLLIATINSLFCACSVLPRVQQPSTTSGDVTQTPGITAADIRTAVQTALTNTSTTINDLWPVAAILLIGVVGLVVNNYVVKKCVHKNGCGAQQNSSEEETNE